MTQGELDKLKAEAERLRKSQCHNRDWFRAIDRILDQIIRTKG